MCSYAFVFHACKRTTKTAINLDYEWLIFFNFPHGHFCLWFVPHISEIKTSQEELWLRVPFVPAYQSSLTNQASSQVLWVVYPSCPQARWSYLATPSSQPALVALALLDSQHIPAAPQLHGVTLPESWWDAWTACGQSWLSWAVIEDCFFWCFLFILHARIAHQGLWQLQSRCYHVHCRLDMIGPLHEKCTISKGRFLNSTKSWPYHHMVLL